MTSRAAVAAAALLAAAGAEALQVSILQPRAGEVAYGEVRVVVAADAPLARMELLVDGRAAGERTSPPWELTVDVGTRSVEHLFLVIAHGPAGETARAEVATSPLRVDEEISVDLRQLYLTARDRNGRVTDLSRDELTVLDEGRPQRTITFERGDIPFTAMLMVDASASMASSKLPKALDGARAFVAGMRPLDEAALLAFADRALRITPFAGAARLAQDGVPAITAAGGTAIADNLYLALKLLEQRNGRRTVILLTDGIDLHSALSIDEVRYALRHSQVLVYWIRIADREGALGQGDSLLAVSSPWRTGRELQHDVESLQGLAVEGGGRVIDIHSVVDIEPAFREVLAELRDQYVIGFYPSGLRHDGSWRRVEVRARRPGVRVEPTGYLDF